MKPTVAPVLEILGQWLTGQTGPGSPLDAGRFLPAEKNLIHALRDFKKRNYADSDLFARRVRVFRDMLRDKRYPIRPRAKAAAVAGLLSLASVAGILPVRKRLNIQLDDAAVLAVVWGVLQEEAERYLRHKRAPLSTFHKQRRRTTRGKKRP